ncbi:alpha/beta fold hydrolase [Demequina muriae]|uniref:Alpha/beta hydrolase n=1 Tax=Demequina muriae TaxID=3051664 RepID=A0ABT8GHI1_9MICO|nr:alpha/beta hydrolase [Demequina sp. EGI L300058]MDN4480893.1 alpha/beta hydrolase [Demequina sp. EGI L300058]
MSDRPPFLYRSGTARVDQPYRHGPLSFRVLADADPSADASAPVFVLVHGIGMSHRYLSRLHAALATTGPTFSIDMPGYAGLPKPTADVDVPTMARGLAGAIASLEVGPVVLIGHSMGAQWATAVAVESPELVERLVLIGPVADSEHRSLPAQAAGLVRDSLGESPRANAIIVTDYLRCGMPWYLAQTRHLLSYKIEEDVARLTVPALIIRGARDPISGPEWCGRLRDRIPVASLIQIPGHHHVVQDSAPHAVESAILTFVDDPKPSRGVAT